MQIDYDSVELTINRIENNNQIISYVMDPAPDLHMGCPIFFDDEGMEYQPDLVSRTRLPGNDPLRMVEYAIEFFADNDPGFSIGKKLRRKRPLWKLNLPDSRLISVDYCVQINEFLSKEFIERVYFSVTENGYIIVKKEKPKSNHLLQKNTWKIDRSSARKLLDDLLRCVSEVDCYQNDYYDDTARKLIYHFENGQQVEYTGVFAFGQLPDDYVDTTQLIEKFMRLYCIS